MRRTLRPPAAVGMAFVVAVIGAGCGTHSSGGTSSAAAVGAERQFEHVEGAKIFTICSRGVVPARTAD